RSQRGARSERDRAHQSPHHPAALLRRLSPQPTHWCVHPRRRGHQQHCRGGDDHGYDGVVTGNITWHEGEVTRQQRSRVTGGPGATVWFTGLSGSGKSTIAAAVEVALIAEGRAAYRLDGDNIRHGLNADLGFSAEHRSENVRRIGEVARLFADAGVVALV